MAGATTASSPVTGINPVGTYNFNTGVTNVTYRAEDTAGNAVTCTFTVTINDNIAPTIGCPVNISQNTAPNLCNAVVVTPNPTTNDNCAITKLTWMMTGATIASSPLTGINNIGTYTFNKGITTITYTVGDAAGNSNSCIFLVTVHDNQDPTISCSGNINQGTNTGSCNATVSTVNTTTSDNCEVSKLTWTMTGAITAQSPSTGTNNIGTYTFSTGITHIVYRVEDATGNSASCSYDVTITDTEKPVISGCPANVNINTGAGQTTCDQSYSWTEPTATDNCTPGAGLVWTKSQVPGATFPVGTTTVTYTAKDASGNVSLPCSFTVTVTDNTTPAFIAPNPVTIYTDITCNANRLPSTTGNPSSLSDNCTPTASLIVGYSDGSNVPGFCTGTYSFTRTWTVRDATEM